MLPWAGVFCYHKHGFIPLVSEYTTLQGGCSGTSFYNLWKTVYRAIHGQSTESENSQSERSKTFCSRTFFRKGKLRKFCITDGGFSKEIPFDEAVLFFECKENEEQKKLPDSYFDYIAKNKEEFGQPITTEISFTARKGKSKTEKIIRDLKGLINCMKYTQDDKAYIQSVINAFGSRTIPEKLAKKLSDYFETEFDDLKLLAGIKQIVPDTFLNSDVRSGSKVAQKREIVLSEYLLSRGD